MFPLRLCLFRYCLFIFLIVFVPICVLSFILLPLSLLWFVSLLIFSLAIGPLSLLLSFGILYLLLFGYSLTLPIIRLSFVSLSSVFFILRLYLFVLCSL
jgi:hypothetical protein